MQKADLVQFRLDRRVHQNPMLSSCFTAANCKYKASAPWDWMQSDTSADLFDLIADR
jgi:hypothetical protein